MSDRYGDPARSARGKGSGGALLDDDWSSALATASLLVVAAVLLVFVTGHLSAWMFERGWPRYDLADAPGILQRLAEDPTEPSAAWAPVNRGTQPPGPVAWWGVYLLLATRVVTLTTWSRRLGTRVLDAATPANPAGWAPWRDPRRHPHGGRWASWHDERRLRPRRGHGARVVVGYSAHLSPIVRFVQVVTGIGGRRKVAVHSLHSLLVIGPANSGKSSGVAIPAILEWPGLVVVATPKTAVVERTIGWRSRLGDVHVFDPGDTSRFHSSGWSPLEGSDHWDGARRMAQDMAAAAGAAAELEPDGHRVATRLVAKALAPYLFAAALTNRKVGELAYWLDSEQRDDVLAELAAAHPDVAHAHLQATFRLDEATRLAVFEAMRSLFEPYLDPLVARSAERHEIVADELLDGGPHTLYIVTPYHSRARLRPICASIVRQLVTRAYEHAGATGAPLTRPALLVLDEGAAIAPMADLHTVASGAGLSGLQLVTLFQDVAQIHRRYHDQAAAVVNNHRAKLYLPTRFDFETVADEPPLRAGSARSGATGEAGHIAAGSSEAALRRALLPPSHARQLTEGEGVLLYGNLAPIRIRLRRWYRNRALRRRVELPQDVLAPAPRRSADHPLRAAPSPRPSLPTPAHAQTRRTDRTAPLPPNVTRLGTRRRDDLGRQR